MTRFRSIVINIFILIMILVPALTSHAETTNTPFVFCNQSVDPATGKFVGPECGWKELVELTQNLINQIILIAVPFAAIVFAYAGFKILSSGGNTSKMEEGKKMITKVAQGIVIMLAAWLIVNTIINALLGDGYSLL